MNGKAVDRVVRDFVRPALREAGFDAFSGRGAWRHHDQTVDLVVFRSFSAYIADGVGCTTFSFAVSAGVFYACMTDEDVPRPKDYELTFGFELVKSLQQPYFHHYGSLGSQDRPDVWYVLPDGSNLMECVVDALDAIKASGLPLIDRFTTPAHAFQALLTETSIDASFGNPGMTMPGAPGSPRWRETLAIGHLVTTQAESENTEGSGTNGADTLGRSATSGLAALAADRTLGRAWFPAATVQRGAVSQLRLPIRLARIRR